MSRILIDHGSRSASDRQQEKHPAPNHRLGEDSQCSVPDTNELIHGSIQRAREMRHYTHRELAQPVPGLSRIGPNLPV